jgi:hypothetical protein
MLAPAIAFAQGSSPIGVWRQANLKWKQTPSVRNEKIQSADGRVLYFRSDHAFSFIEGTISRGSNWEWISSKHERSIYIGTWTANGNSIRVVFRLVSRGLESKKETLFGPLQTEDVSFGERTLLFRSLQFEPSNGLENDLQVVLPPPGMITERSMAAEGRCPQDTRPVQAATQFRVSLGEVTMPIGAFLLIRKGNQMGAIRLTGIENPPPPKSLPKSYYESYILPEGSVAFNAPGIDRHHGEIFIGETIGMHPLTYTKGHYKAEIGKWKFGFDSSSMIDMAGFSSWNGDYDAGFEFAPTSACQLSEIDATDPNLQWLRWDRTTQTVLPLEDLSK